MKRVKRACLIAALMALPVAASAQNDTAPKAEAPKAAPGMMMACPMMGDMAAMQKDMGAIMSEVEGMMKDAKDPAQHDDLQKMHEQMAAMMVNMQKMGMGGMMGNMMGGAMPGAAQPNNTAPAAPATPATPPAGVSPEDHQAHHPAQ